MGARGWAGVVLSLFPVQTLGELGVGEVISCSNCKVESGGGGLSHMNVMAADQGLHLSVYAAIIL